MVLDREWYANHQSNRGCGVKLDYCDITMIRREEERTAALVPLPKTFYSDVKILYQTLKTQGTGELEGYVERDAYQELKNISRTIDIITERRRRKIVLATISVYCKCGSIPERLPLEDRYFFDEIINALYLAESHHIESTAIKSSGINQKKH